MREQLRRAVLLLTEIACISLVMSGPAAIDAGSFRLLKSQSGASGRVVDDRFVFDDVRTRFVFPQDKSLNVYFEWEGPPGNHVLSALWKDPDGRVVSISPDLRMETKTPQLNAYWIFELAPGYRSGIWTVEIRIDGEPSGSHSFELVMPEPVKIQPPPAPPKLPTLDELYSVAGKSLVWIYPLDASGHHMDTALGFVIAKDSIATAFQAIDSSRRFEIVFADGNKVDTDEVWACNRLQDWALLKADTTGIPALAMALNESVPVGERYIVFNVESSARVIGGVDITGKRSTGVFGDRIQIAPSPAREAAGGPLLNPKGQVAGIVGGSTVPGSRFGKLAISMNPALWSRHSEDVAATPISLLPAQRTDVQKLSDLIDRGVLTPPLVLSASFDYGGSARNISKNPLGDTVDASEFSHADQVVWIYTLWQKKTKESKGIVAAQVYDYRNQLLVDVVPKKVALVESRPVRIAFDFPLKSLSAGTYRVDVLWNGLPAWRTFITVTD